VLGVSVTANAAPRWLERPVDAQVRARVVAMLAELRACEPAAWATGLSIEGARAAWEAALAGLDPDDTSRRVDGRPPRRVGIVCSGNVYTAPLEWTVALVARGVDVVLKPASGHEVVVEAIAHAIEAGVAAAARADDGVRRGGRVAVRCWHGGDVDAERAALAGCDAVMGFGGAASMAAIGERMGVLTPAPIWLPFGPKAGVAVIERLDAHAARALAWDHALHDGRGCMSPAAVLAVHVHLDAFGRAMAELAARCPPGRGGGASALTPAEGAAIRSRTALARVCGGVWGDGTVLALPLAHLQLTALPRVAVVHAVPSVESALDTLAPLRASIGTLATDRPDLVATAWGQGLPAPRVCATGEMQRPPFARLHDGVDVLAELWGAAPPS
jgi:hypothetical protein